MRRSRFAREGFGERTLLRKQNCRCLSGKLIEVANQVGLVVVTTVDGDRRPFRIDTFDGAEDLLKSQDAAEKFWTDADIAHEAPLQLATADAGVSGELIDRYETGGTDYSRRKSRRRRGIVRTSKQSLQQRRFNC